MSRRSSRLALAVGGMAAFTVFCVMLIERGYVPATASAYLLVGVWSGGGLALLLTDRATGRFDSGALSLTKAIWCNLGVVLIALLVPHAVRLLLLVVPLFGILYTALHLEQRQVVAVALLTWLAYLAGVGVLLALAASDPEFEGLLALAFSLMVAAMVYMAGEVTALRDAFARRSERLNAVLRQLSELAMRDELTGLYNRRYIMEVLARHKALADRGQVGFAVCYCDLDHFKRVNDQFGHVRGDRVLEAFARIAQDVVRSTDFVARLGGEEFLLVLVGADAATAITVAERLCARTRRIEVAEDPQYRLTVSIGIACFDPGERLEDVIQRADFSLYQAKSRGRDQIVVAPPRGPRDL